LVHGSVLGNGDLAIHAAHTLKEAKAGDITFVENEKYAGQLLQSQASAAVVPPGTPASGKALIQVADPLMAFVVVFQHLRGATTSEPSGVDPRAAVHSSAQIGENSSVDALVKVGAGAVISKRCQLHAGVVIGQNCRIGDDVVLYPNVVLYHDIILGDRVIIHANAVIGADGYGYRCQQGRHVKVPQLSHVVIGSDVEIGAGSTIDRGTFEPTRIGDGTKIDNLVQVAHNCVIGKHNLVAAQVGIGGSSSTGNYVILGGQVGVADHIEIGDGVLVGAQTGVSAKVQAGEQLMGFPARPMRVARRIYACLNKLPEMRRDISRLRKMLGMSSSSIENAAEVDQ